MPHSPGRGRCRDCVDAELIWILLTVVAATATGASSRCLVVHFGDLGKRSVVC